MVKVPGNYQWKTRYAPETPQLIKFPQRLPGTKPTRRSFDCRQESRLFLINLVKWVDDNLAIVRSLYVNRWRDMEFRSNCSTAGTDSPVSVISTMILSHERFKPSSTPTGRTKMYKNVGKPHWVSRSPHPEISRSEVQTVSKLLGVEAVKPAQGLLSPLILPSPFPWLWFR